MVRTEIGELNLCTIGRHRIITTSETPICQRNGRIPVNQEGIISDEIEINLRLGIIRESRSPWCIRIVLTPKQDGSWRMCIDYRSLNKITIRDSYMSPRVYEIYDELSKTRVFSILDATSGYYQIAMEEGDKEKAAFSFKGRLYEYNRMPFKLCNAPETIQRSMDAIFRSENMKFVIPYLDNIIVYSQRI
ncbi:Transposon Ty3-I Gag-Pol polyprotein [Nosema granulosis]|uniref:Transposon Ty3-I Gag-Pol polyprotein n=1 Tax=Nosema granulosis TaxID=83296 RepID=A0A9P6GXE1_9MICR|nr:Transposon Ty3-I Gag-Pol polyprotein [Nosema granulosis]